MNFTSSVVFSVVSPTGSRPPSRNRNNEMPGDEELGFEAAVAALGTYISRLFNVWLTVGF